MLTSTLPSPNAERPINGGPTQDCSGSDRFEPIGRGRAERSHRILSAQSRHRRDNLIGTLNRLAAGERLRPRESLDLVMAVIEDAHSSDPVLFGPHVAGHYAALEKAKRAMIEAKRALKA